MTVAPGALDVAVERVLAMPAARAVVISDARVARLYGREFARRLGCAGFPSSLIAFPPGERSKTRETKARLEDRLVQLGAGRDVLIVALGGGVTTDLAGFVAATWQRGVPFIAVPTSLLAMVDAGLGGKTAVDHPAGKNLIGAFHHPAALFADPRVLRTLPDRAYREGLAEAVKMAVILDRELFRFLESSVSALVARRDSVLAPVIARCLSLKARVVAEDPRETGRRMILNFGHTAGHAIEIASGYRMPHGLAVSIGLVAEARLAQRLTGFPAAHVARIESLLRSIGLPVVPRAAWNPDLLLSAMRKDKKSRGGQLRAALPIRIGRMPAGSDPAVVIDARRDLMPFLAAN